MAIFRHAPRLLVVPGLNDSGPGHWQSWLEAQHRDAKRVVQRDWSRPDLERWAARIAVTLENTLDGAGDQHWVAVAHSFGCLALVRHLALQPDSPIRAALLVAPAEPDKFGLADALPQTRLPVPTTLVASDDDPWMNVASTRRWATRWGSTWLTLGAAGHVNAESGFATLPLARRWVASVTARLAREQRPARASFAEWSFAV